VGKWLILGTLLGALICVGLGAIGWPRHFKFNSPSLGVVEDVMAPGTPVTVRAVIGCLLGFLGGAIAVVSWNTIVLPAWLLRQTSVPLAKVALGLGLIFTGMLLSMRNVNVGLKLFPDMPLLDALSTLLMVLGPILCLEIAPRARSSGVLLWAVAFVISALVIGAHPDVDQVKFKNGTFSWSGLLIMASLPLFLVFFQRLARILERPALEHQVRLIFKLMVGCLAGIGIGLAGFFLGGVALLVQIPVLLGVMASFLLILIYFFSLIRGLQVDIMRRL
jgi:hypothetical protein